MEKENIGEDMDADAKNEHDEWRNTTKASEQKAMKDEDRMTKEETVKKEAGLKEAEEEKQKEEVHGGRTIKEAQEKAKPKAPERQAYKLKGGTSIKPNSGKQRETVDRKNGLENLGNTCYMNALLQCLARCKRLQTELRTNKAEEREGYQIAQLLRREMKEVVRTERETPHSPREL